MYSISSNDLKVLSSEQFRESIAEPQPNTKIYLAYGKVDSWANEPLPEIANSSTTSINSFWRNMMGAKRIADGDVTHVIRRYDWTPNTVYSQYDSHDPTLYNPDVKFYVLNSEFNVYKCISNNNGANSDFEPLTVSTNNTIQTSDGYIWKFMYSLSDVEKRRFTTSAFLPVRTLSVDNGSRQWDVQAAAVDGAIHNIIVTNPGTNYTNTSNIIITVSGDGNNATAIANVNTSSNTISSIIVTGIGQGYREATVSISGGGGSGAAARAIISPKGGHGSDALYELGGSFLMFNPRLENNENGKLSTNNDFRQIGIITDPFFRLSNVVASNTVVSQTTDLALSGQSSDYMEDEWVYQGRSLEEASFKGQVVSWNSSTGIIKLTNVYGEPTTDGLIGANTTASRFVTSVTYPELEPYSGKVLYINNITPISRSTAQTEDFKIVIKF